MGVSGWDDTSHSSLLNFKCIIVAVAIRFLLSPHLPSDCSGHRPSKDPQTNNLPSVPLRCQRRFPVRLVPTMAVKEKATLLKGLFVSVFVSLCLLSSLSFMTAPFSFSTPPPQRDRHGVWEIGEGGVSGESQKGKRWGGGCSLKENGKN